MNCVPFLYRRFSCQVLSSQRRTLPSLRTFATHSLTKQKAPPSAQSYRLSFLRRDFSTAVQLVQWKHKQPKNIEDYDSRAREFFDLGAYEAAKKDFQQVILENPSAIQGWFGKAQCEVELGNLLQGLADYQEVARLAPEYIPTFVNMANCLLQLGETEKALLNFDYILHLDQRNHSAYGGRGEAYFTLGKYEEALKDFQKALELLPSSEPALSGLGKTYLQMQNFLKAADYYKRAIQKKPTVSSFLGLGTAMYYLDEPEAAAHAYTVAMEIRPYSKVVEVDILCKRAAAFLLMEKYKEAVVDVEKARKLRPELTSPCLLLGQAYHYLEMKDKAIENLTTFLNNIQETDLPHKFEAIAMRGICFERLFVERSKVQRIEETRAMSLNEAEQKSKTLAEMEESHGLLEVTKDQIALLRNSISDFLTLAKEQPDNEEYLQAVKDNLAMWERHIQTKQE